MILDGSTTPHTADAKHIDAQDSLLSLCDLFPMGTLKVPDPNFCNRNLVSVRCARHRLINFFLELTLPFLRLFNQGPDFLYLL